jgi:hypothetical protein
MSDTSEHSDLSPRGDNFYRKRQNGPRGYGQGKVLARPIGGIGVGAGGGNLNSGVGVGVGVGVASSVAGGGGNMMGKPVKYRLQGGQRPLKISVKSSSSSTSNDNNIVNNRGENIGNLISQGYPNHISGEGNGRVLAPQLISINGAVSNGMGIGTSENNSGSSSSSSMAPQHGNMNMNMNMMPVDKANNVGRNRSLPVLQQIKTNL